MNQTNIRRALYSGLITAICLGVLAMGQGVFAGGIDSLGKFAWSTNAGWINFNAGSNGQVTVYADRLEGDAYGENIGWIRLKGTAQDNTAYGVTNDGCGNLSGYAWGTNVGWINFAPSPSNGSVAPVTMDPVTGEFDGYAYGENIGYIRFKGMAVDGTAYKVQAGPAADPMESLVTGYETDIAAIIGGGRRPGPATSTGLILADNSFLGDAGDCIILGHDGATGVSTADRPIGILDRWARSWEFNKHDAATTGGTVDITFDFGDAGFAITPAGSTDNYRLLKRSSTSGDFTDITAASGATVSVSGDQVIFTGVDVGQLGSFFTLGSTNGSLPVTLSYFLATPGGNGTRIEWSTATESGNAGFNLYVETDAGRQRINPELIPSAVIDSAEPQDYAYDAAGVQGEFFTIEQVDITGGRELFGPFALGVPFGSRMDADPVDDDHRIFLPWVLNR